MPESGVTLNLTAKLTDKSAVPVLNSTVSVKKNNVASTDLTATVSNNNTLTITKNAGASLTAGDVYTVSVKDGDNNTAQVTVTIKADTVTLDGKDVALDDKTVTWANAFELSLKLNGQAVTSAATGLQINGKNSGADAAAPTVADDGANGKVKVTVTPGTTKFGTYEITGKYNNKKFKATFVYKAGSPTEVTGKPNSADTVYELGETSAVDTGALFLDKDGVKVAGAAASDATHDTSKHGIKVATANKGASKLLYVPAGSTKKLYIIK